MTAGTIRAFPVDGGFFIPLADAMRAGPEIAVMMDATYERSRLDGSQLDGWVMPQSEFDAFLMWQAKGEVKH